MRVTRVGVASEGIGVVARGEVEAVAAALTLREGYRQRGPHELGVVEPRHRRFRRVRVRVGHRGVALGKAGVAIAVQPDLVASPLLVLLQRADGAEVRGDVLLGDDVGEARDVHRVVALRGGHGDTRCARRPCALTVSADHDLIPGKRRTVGAVKFNRSVSAGRRTREWGTTTTSRRARRSTRTTHADLPE